MCTCKVRYHPEGYPGFDAGAFRAWPRASLVEEPHLQVLAEFKNQRGGSGVQGQVISGYWSEVVEGTTAGSAYVWDVCQ